MKYGSIPAPAGETIYHNDPGDELMVHPRACGGNSGPPSQPPIRSGPSPRLRGKLGSTFATTDTVRSIPAPAGETRVAVQCGRFSGVHPRACGGNIGRGYPPSRPWGPSPRLRGKRCQSSGRVAHPGSIPAPAGETRTTRFRRDMTRVHPRACGGNAYGWVAARGEQGPSPRLRGKLRRLDLGPTCHGSIPAPAGETS